MLKRFLRRLVPAPLLAAYHYLLAFIAAWKYGWPSRDIRVIGVTGTGGKSTTVHLLARVLEHGGHTVGYTSTAVYKVGNEEILNPDKMTMMGRFRLQAMLRRMVDEGCDYAVVETTSQGVVQFRHRFINYDTIIFTGIYPEHIEAHGSFDAYKAAKLELCAHVARSRRKVLGGETIGKTLIGNGDDEHIDEFMNFNVERKIRFGLSALEFDDGTPPYRVRAGETTAAGTSFFVSNVKIYLKLFGELNIYNALAATAAGLNAGMSLSVIAQALEAVPGVPGRFEQIDAGQPFTVVVDYAYEPKALGKLYETVARLPHQRVIHVLGSAGGGRDTWRRPVLGKIAGEQAALVIVTDEDPYDEDPRAIMEAVAEGAREAGKKDDINLFVIPDRRAAIRRALEEAGKKDLVLITGKGSEQGLCVAHGKMLPWDDREVVREELAALGHVGE